MACFAQMCSESVCMMSSVNIPEKNPASGS
jgi:hypothetical protein